MFPLNNSAKLMSDGWLAFCHRLLFTVWHKAVSHEKQENIFSTSVKLACICCIFVVKACFCLIFRFAFTPAATDNGLIIQCKARNSEILLSATRGLTLDIQRKHLLTLTVCNLLV